jgi:hypothetical protein
VGSVSLNEEPDAESGVDPNQTSARAVPSQTGLKCSNFADAVSPVVAPSAITMITPSQRTSLGAARWPCSPPRWYAPGTSFTKREQVPCRA